MSRGLVVGCNTNNIRAGARVGEIPENADTETAGCFQGSHIRPQDGRIGVGSIKKNLRTTRIQK